MKLFKFIFSPTGGTQKQRTYWQRAWPPAGISRIP